MRIDFHTHIFPPEIVNDRSRYCEKEPAFSLLYNTPKARLITAETLIAALDESEVDQAVVFGFPWTAEKHFQRHNDYILEAVQKYPHRLIGFCCLDPLHERAPLEVERSLNQGLRGIGELAFYTSGIDDAILDALEPLMEQARSRHLPVLIHTNEPVGHWYAGKSPLTLSQIYALLKRFTNNRIVLAHWGGGIFFYSLLKKEVREVFKNTWFDTAASPFLYDSAVYRQAISLVGQDRILWGSDYPLLPPARYFKEMAAAGLNADEMSAICGLNAAAVLNVQGRLG